MVVISVNRLLAALVVAGICLMIAIFIGENLIILNLLNQGFLRNGLILSFQKEFFARYQNLVENTM